MRRSCEACGRDFRSYRRSYTCLYCGFNTNPRDPMPRSRQSLEWMEQRLRAEHEDEESEGELDEPPDFNTD